MRRALRPLSIMLLWVALPLLAAAQGQDPLQRHATALENLSRSVGLLASDSTASLDALESAAGSLRLLTGDTTSTTLVSAMEQQFDSARAAIGNRSEADLAVQVAVLRGGFQRALLEASLDAVDLDSARAGFDQLAAELSLDTDALDALAGADNLGGLVDGYRAGVARGIADRLAVVRQQFPNDSAAAYVTLAGAYGMSLSIQDAPQTPPGLNAEFGGLIGAVVAGDGSAVELLAAGLQQQLAELGTTGAAVDATPVQAVVAEPAAEQPAEVTIQDSPEPPARAEVEPAAGPEAAAEPATEAGEPAAADEQPAEPAALPAAPALANLVDLQEVTVADETLNALLADLGRRGLRGQAGEDLAAQLQARGFTSFSQVLDEALALAGRAGDAVQRGDQAAGRLYLGQLDGAYRTNVSPLTSRANPAFDDSIKTLTSQLLASPAMHESDIQALTGLLAGIGSSSAGGIADTLQAGSAGWTSGWPRIALSVVTALLAILPLVFLRLAFGGGNRNWSLIGSGLFLLLLPAMLGGIGALLEVAGHLAAVPALLQVAAWLTLDGALQQLLFTVLALLATILLAVGLYGICRQFGLFGGQGGGRKLFGKRNEDKSVTKTLVDWDEDF